MCTELPTSAVERIVEIGTEHFQELENRQTQNRSRMENIIFTRASIRSIGKLNIPFWTNGGTKVYIFSAVHTNLQSKSQQSDAAWPVKVTSHNSSAAEIKDGGRVWKAWAPWLWVLRKSLASELLQKEQTGCVERNKTRWYERERSRTGVGGGKGIGKVSAREHCLLLRGVCELGLSAHRHGVCRQRWDWVLCMKAVFFFLSRTGLCQSVASPAAKWSLSSFVLVLNF